MSGAPQRRPDHEGPARCSPPGRGFCFRALPFICSRHPEVRAKRASKSSKDSCTHCNEQHPSRRAEDGAHLTGERNCVHPGDDVPLYLDSNFKQPAAFSRHAAPEFCKIIRPIKKEGAGKTGCALHPRSHVQKCSRKTHTSIQVQRKQSGLPCAMVLTAYSALSSVTGLSCHRRSQEALASRELDTSVGVSGPHDFAVRKLRVRLCAQPTSIAPRAQRP